MPFKTWAPFERLLSADMNTYLAQQVAATFATAAARDAAIPAPVTGQPCYLTGLRVYQVWTGSAWASVAWSGGDPSAVLQASAAQSIPNNAFTLVTHMSTVDFDSHGFALGGGILTIPAGLDGYYLVDVQVNFATHAAATQRQISINGGGATLVQIQAISIAANDTHLSGTAIKRLTAGQTVSLYAFQVSGAALNLNPITGQASRMTIVRLRD